VINFPRDAAPDEVPQAILNNMAYIYVPVVVVFYMIAIYILTKYKITRSSHQDNLQAIVKN